jgi:hypothetical protein
MAIEWDRLAEQSKIYEQTDFERAAYRLVTSQVLSAGDIATRKDFHIVSDHLKEYVKALDLFGINVRHNAEFRYVVAQPRHIVNLGRATKATTLLTLVLRSRYHDIRNNGQEGDFGEGHVDLPDLQEAYIRLTQEPMPKISEIREQMADLERWGIAKRTDPPIGDTQPFQIVIHPAIQEIVAEEWLNLLDGLRNNGESDGEGQEGDDVSA